MTQLTLFSFDGEHPIVFAKGITSPNTRPVGVGLHTIFGVSDYPVGTLVTPDGSEITDQVNMSEVRQLAKDEVMRLYEEQVYGVESVPIDLVITEWREKENVALAWVSGQLPASPHPLTDGYRAAIMASMTEMEKVEFANMTPPLIPGTDDDDICDTLSQRVIGAATAKRVMLHFAGKQRRDANDLIDASPDYPTLAAGLVYIQQQVPIRTANFLAQFNP
jgi:hypothetical protein